MRDYRIEGGLARVLVSKALDAVGALLSMDLGTNRSRQELCLLSSIRVPAEHIDGEEDDIVGLGHGRVSSS